MGTRHIAKTSCLQPAIRLLLILLLPVAAQQLKFERIGNEQGLTQNQITAILQDSQGYMWFGTTDGLGCYDGYKFVTFRYTPGDSTSISGNYILSMLEDGNGYLWIRTRGGGVNRYNPITKHFIHFHKDVNNPLGLSENEVTTLFLDHFGTVWVGTYGGGINRFIPARNGFQHFKNNPQQPGSLGSNLVSIMFQDSRGYLWVGSKGGGLNRSLEPLADSSNPNDITVVFQRFGVSEAGYLPSLHRRIDLIVDERSPLESHIHPQNLENSRSYFELKRPAAVLVVAMGEGDAYGMSDYGWIRAQDDRPLWSMSYRSSISAGGSPRNRLQYDVINLKPGKYSLGYVSDAQHSFAGWLDTPPADSLLWGIRLYVLANNEAASVKRALAEREAPPSLPDGWITALREDRDGDIWIGTAGGLARLRAGTSDKFDIYEHFDNEPWSLSHNFVQQIYEDKTISTSDLWIVCDDGVLNRLDRRSGTFQHFAFSRDLAGAGSEQNVSVPTVLYYDRKGILWVGSEDGLIRLSLLHPATGLLRAKPVITTYKSQPNNSQSLSYNSITALYEDRSGLLWIGTSRGGLNKISLRKDKFRHYTATGDSNSLSSAEVTALTMDHAGVLWVGTRGGGLNELSPDPTNPRDYRYRHLRYRPGVANGLSSDLITSVYEDPSHNLWIGTDGGGLNRLDARREIFTVFRHNPRRTKSLSSDNVTAILEDQYGQLWIGTQHGLNKFDSFRGEFKRYVFDPDDPYSLSHNDVQVIYEDFQQPRRGLWIGTQGGLNRFNRNSDRFFRYIQEFDNPVSLNNSSILSMLHDEAGNLWLGTHSGGLNRLDRETGGFDFVTDKQGLANNSVRSILEDDNRNLWLATNLGLSKYSPRNGKISNYDITDGLQNNVFSSGAAYKAATGEMLFGGIGGFNRFYPDSVKDSNYVPPVVITDFRINNVSQLQRLLQAVNKNETMQLSWSENLLNLEFAVLDYGRSRNNAYRSILQGMDNDLQISGEERIAAYTNLSPGAYHLHISGANSDGNWNRTGVQVDFVIYPPFWETAWFRLLLLAIFLGSAYGFYRYRVNNRLRMEQVRLQENERVRAKAAHDFHDELGHKLTKINLFSELVRRNPDATPEIRDYLMRINENSKGLTGGMRDFIWTLDPEKDSLHEVAVRLKDFGDELFDKTGVAFRVAGMSDRMEQLRLSTDWRRDMVLIFKEAMNNTLKHAESKNVTLNFSLTDDTVELILNDDGVGLAHLPGNTEDDSDGELENTGRREGNGLNNMRMRAKRLGGELVLYSNGKGTTVKFRAKMPQRGN